LFSCFCLLSLQNDLLCFQWFLHPSNFGSSLGLVRSASHRQTENDLTFWSFRMLKSSAATILSSDITSRLAGSVRHIILEQNNHRRGRDLFSLSMSRVLRSSFVLVFSSMMMIW
jgi:hypothetical protein